MSILVLFFLIFIASMLIPDFKKDPGKNIKAKIFHSVILTILILAFGSTPIYLGKMLKNYSSIRETFASAGIFSGRLYFAIYHIELILSMAIIFIASNMASRKNLAREWLIRLLPLLSLTLAFSYYRSWILKYNHEIIANDYTILLMGFIFFAGLSSIIIMIYNSRMMKCFFGVPISHEFAENT